jgi:site-specific DNA-methyltransferase (adenine-specific)
VKPYYERDGIVIYHGDCREILPTLAPVDLVLTDPPYGISLNTQRAKAQGRGTRAYKRDWPSIEGDAGPFDPSFLLCFKKVILFGANYYADKLPTSSAWIIWDKVDDLKSGRDVGFNDHPDAELAWSSFSGPMRIIRHRWMGVLRDSENGATHLHPTQKPVALMSEIINWRTVPGETILDPFMGSGTTLRAAKDLGRKAIGIEIEEKYCEIAAKRLSQSVLPMYDGWADNGWLVKGGYLLEEPA